MEREQLAWDNLIAAFDREWSMLLDVATMAAKAGNGAPMTALLQRIEVMVELFNACNAPPDAPAALN